MLKPALSHELDAPRERRGEQPEPLEELLAGVALEDPGHSLDDSRHAVTSTVSTLTACQ